MHFSQQRITNQPNAMRRAKEHNSQNLRNLSKAIVQLSGSEAKTTLLSNMKTLKHSEKWKQMTIRSDIGLQDKRLKRDRMMRKNTAEDQETIQRVLRLRRSPLNGLQTTITRGKLRAKRNQPDNTIHEQLVEALQKMLL